MILTHSLIAARCIDEQRDGVSNLREKHYDFC